jgi:hypothetical protein
MRMDDLLERAERGNLEANEARRGEAKEGSRRVRRRGGP